MTTNEATYSTLSTHSRPKLGRLLHALHLDTEFTRGEGNYLFYQDENGTEIPVSDYVGGYGSLLLGHYHPDLKSLAIELLDAQLPHHAQLSSKPAIEQLSQYISDELRVHSGKSYITTLANSGAEAVEAAIKHARWEFSAKKAKLIDRLDRELHAINHHFFINNSAFKLEIEGQEISDFQALKTHCSREFDRVFNEHPPVMLALEKSFHGKTTGALNLTSNKKFRDGFQPNTHDKSQVVFVAHTKAALNEVISSLIHNIQLPKLQNGKITFDEVPVLMCLGIIIEPIQGEGGIRPIDRSFLAHIRAKTIALKIPLIFDEIQCGSYRTGTFVHAIQLGIYADYFLLSKSFGGGMVKNAALVIDKKHYQEGFGVIHTSTYSDDTYSARISLKALEISKHSTNEVLEKGALLGTALGRIHAKYKSVVREVRGTGLMWGIEFFDLDFSENYSFQMFSRSGYLNYLYSSYLLNQWNIRVAPTLSDSNTLRILPSIFISENDIVKLETSLDALCKIVHHRDFYKLIEHLLPEDQQNVRELVDFGQGEVKVLTDESLEISVGFISHYVNENGVRDGDPSMSVLSNETINALLESVLEISVPILLDARTIQGSSGKTINVYFAGMLFTAAMAREMMTKNLFDHYAEICNDAVDLLHDSFGCSLVGLGQYSSVITKNGKAIRNPDVCVTTGNSYTVGIGVKAIYEEISDRLNRGESLTLGVLGAAGNICSTYVKCFLPHFSRMLLKGSESDGGKLKTLRFLRELTVYMFTELLENEHARSTSIHPYVYDLLLKSTTFDRLVKSELSINDLHLMDHITKELGSKFPFQLIDSLDELVQCDVTVVATNTPEPFLYSRYFAEHSIVYDISVPLNSTDELIHNSKNIKVIMGGVVQLPQEQTITMRAYPLGEGEAFACISETILLGLENQICNFSYGNLHPSQVHYMDQLGSKHGFKLKKNKLETIF